jgi:hypothetical protein
MKTIHKIELRNILLSVTIVIIFSLCTNPIHVSAKLNRNYTPKELIDLSNKSDPNKPTKKKFLKQDKKNELLSDQDNLKIETQGTNFTFKDKLKGSFKVILPLTQNHKITTEYDGAQINSGENTTYDILSEPVDGGLQNVITLKNEQAPVKYDFLLTENIGDSINLESNGSVTIKDINGNLKTLILPPWAKDANGKNLLTKFTINDNVLTQHIDTKNAIFPVTADPTWCGNIISSIWWGWTNAYGGKFTTHVKPTWCGRVSGNLTPAYGILGAAANTWFAWAEFYDKTPWNENWNWSERQYGTNKYWSMYNQFICHYINPLAATKVVWRIDWWRPNKGLVATYWNKCNIDE